MSAITPERTEARHDGLAVCALIFAFLFWPLSILFGHLSRNEAKRSGRRPSVLATSGLIISYLGMAGIALFIIAGILGS